MNDQDKDAVEIEITGEIAEISDPATPSLDGLQFERVTGADDDALIADDTPFVVFGQTNRVKVYNIVCSGAGGGATSSFYTADAGWGLNLRFGFYTAAGGRLGLSTIFTWDQAIKLNTGFSWRVKGYLPRGTKQVRGFWWLSQPNSGVATYWAPANCNC